MPPLTTADSAEIRVAVITKLLEDLGPDEPPPRIWVRSGNRVTAGPEKDDDSSFSAEEWKAISDAFPAARLAAPPDTVFLCAPGVRLMMPGTGCPVREGGVVVAVSPVVQQGDSVLVRGTIARSTPRTRGDGYLSWAAGLHLIFEKAEGVWRIRRVAASWVT